MKRQEMLGLAGLVLVLMSLPVAAHRDDMVINLGTELRDWCRDESEAALIGRGLTPANWTARYWDQVNVLMVKGQWRVNGNSVGVDCSVARGAQARYASMSVEDVAP